jgi:hypothetical protein
MCRLPRMQTAQGGAVPRRNGTFLAFNFGRCAALFIAPSGAPVNFMVIAHRDAHACRKSAGQRTGASDSQQECAKNSLEQCHIQRKPGSSWFGKLDNLLTRIRHLLQHLPHAPETLLPGVRLYPDALVAPRKNSSCDSTALSSSAFAVAGKARKDPKAALSDYWIATTRLRTAKTTRITTIGTTRSRNQCRSGLGVRSVISCTLTLRRWVS